MRPDDRPFVDILTGFLGSGKTTLLNALLGDAAFSTIAVVVNEIGAIGIDHLLVSQQAANIALLQGGCLCCAIVDSLPETLLDLCRRRAGGEIPRFDRIVIETTGLADPGAIANVVRHSALLAHFLRPGLILTVVDAAAGASQIADYAEAAAQAALADRIVLSKLDLADPPPSLRAELERINPFAEIVAGDRVRGDPASLFAPVASARPPGERSPAARHSTDIFAHSFAIDAAATRAGLAAWATLVVARFGARLLRCKGLLRVGGERILIQGVGTRFAFEPVEAGDEPCSLTVIGRAIDRAAAEADLPWLHVPEGTQPPPPAGLTDGD